MTDSFISPELQELIRARIDERPFVPPMLRLICNKCNGRYPVGTEPVALAFSPNGATVHAGWLEMCPHCFHGHIGGDVLAVEMVEVVEVVNALQPL